MLHHASLGVRDLQRAARFYDAIMQALGFTRSWTRETAIGYGYPGGEDQVAIKLAGDLARAPGPRFHLALTAPDRSAVEAFHREALLNGGTDDGPPGYRPHYGPHYFAAFVIDPDGHPIEAVYIKDQTGK